MNNKIKGDKKIFKDYNPAYSLFSLIVLAILIVPAIYFFSRPDLVNHENKLLSSLVTIDSLITGATITLIVISNFAPSSSGSSSMIRRVYWNKIRITSKATPTHRMLWYSFLSFVPPLPMILFSVLITSVEALMSLFKFDCSNLVIYVGLMISVLILIGSAIRFYLFHKYAVRNTASYIYNKAEKIIMRNSKEIKKKEIDSMIYFISFLKGTANFELVKEILRFFLNSNEILKIHKLYVDNFNSFIESRKGEKVNLSEYMMGAWENKPDDENYKDDQVARLIWTLVYNVWKFALNNKLQGEHDTGDKEYDFLIESIFKLVGSYINIKNFIIKKPGKYKVISIDANAEFSNPASTNLNE